MNSPPILEPIVVVGFDLHGHLPEERLRLGPGLRHAADHRHGLPGEGQRGMLPEPPLRGAGFSSFSRG